MGSEEGKRGLAKVIYRETSSCGDTHRVKSIERPNQSIFRITIKVTCTPVSTLHRWFTEPGHETSSSSTLIFDTRETVASWQKRDDRRIRNRGFNPPLPDTGSIRNSFFFFPFFFFPHSAPFENKRDQIYIYILYALYTSIDSRLHRISWIF